MTTALVTGANRGLGLEVARQLAARDWRVILACRDLAKARTIAAELPRAEARALDLADGASIAALARDLARDGVALDVLVNNAAVSLRGFDADVARKTLAINLRGPRALAAALGGAIVDGGAIVMVSSAMGELSNFARPVRDRIANAASLAEVDALASELVESVRARRHAADGWPGNAYSVSKALLNAATRVLARELAPRRIRVNAVCPGWVRTDLGGPHAPRDVATGGASIVATVLEPRATGGFFRDGRAIAW